MARVIAAIFLVLHGLVHLLYLGQAARLFELQPGLTWPAGSWIFSKALGDKVTRALASVLCAVAALGFAVGAAGLALDQSWWRPAIAAAAAFSSVLYLLFWNGRMQRIDQQGAVGILINVVIIVGVYLFRWP